MRLIRPSADESWKSDDDHDWRWIIVADEGSINVESEAVLISDGFERSIGGCSNLEAFVRLLFHGVMENVVPAVLEPERFRSRFPHIVDFFAGFPALVII